MAKRNPKRSPSKYHEKIKTAATPEQLAQAIFASPPKPKGEWRYLKRDKK